MALTATTLAADLSATSQTARVTAATGATVGGICKIDQETSIIIAISGTTITLRRTGEGGSAVVAHDVLAPVVFGLTSDLPALGATEIVQTPMMTMDLVSVGENGVIPAPKRNTLYLLTKATALATTTFADPTAAQDGLVVRFVNTTTAAHVITTVNLFDGTSGAHTTVTFAAFPASSLTLVAAKAGWYVVSSNVITSIG